MNMIFQVYIKGTVDAVDFYCRAFDAELGHTGKNDDGTYMHAEIMVKDKCIMFLSESDSSKIGNTMQFCLTFDGDKNAVENAYKVLSEDNSSIIFPLGLFPWGSYGSALIDKYGIYWYIAA